MTDYSPTDHERVLAGDLIETVTDFDLEYDERTEAVFLAFACILAERAKTTQGDEERVNELCNDHNEDGSQSPHLAKDILSLIASIRAEGRAERAKLEAALESIKAEVIGDAEPRWPNEIRVTRMRNRIADYCDLALHAMNLSTSKKDARK